LQRGKREAESLGTSQAIEVNRRYQISKRTINDQLLLIR